MENEAKKASKVWLVPTIIAAVLLVALIAFMLILGKGTKAVSDGTQTLAESVAPLKDGTAQLSDGVDQYTGGVDTIHKAMPTLTDGVQQYTEGVDTLNGYMEKLNAAAPTLASGVKQLADGSSTLKSGVDTYTGGVDQVADGIAQVQGGVPTITGGVTQLTEGAKTLDGFYKAMNGVADQIATGLKGVRKSVTDNDSYKLLLTGANGVAAQLDVNTAGSLAQAVVGMDQIIDSVDSSAAGLASLNGQEATLGTTFTRLNTGGVTADTFVAATTGSLGADMAAQLQPVYAMWLASGTDLSNETEATAFLKGLKVSGATVHSNLNTATAATGGMKPVDISNSAVAGLTQNANDATKNIHTAAVKVAGGIPAVIDTVCTGLEQTADSLTETKTGTSLKSRLKAYTDGVRSLYKGLTLLTSSRS